MISKRAWQEILKSAKDGTTLREAVNAHLEGQDQTLASLGIRTLKMTRKGGLWSAAVNEDFRVGGFATVSEALRFLSNCPINYEDPHSEAYP